MKAEYYLGNTKHDPSRKQRWLEAGRHMEGSQTYLQMPLWRSEATPDSDSSYYGTAKAMVALVPLVLDTVVKVPAEETALCTCI
jgi:hypothetical protein